MATTDTRPFTIFPLKHRSKEPACRFKSRDQFNTDDSENTGVRLDRLLVLDVDVGRLPEGVTLDGAVNTLRDMGVPVDDCPRVRTGSGGEHVYMRLPSDPPKLAARLLPYVDVKAGRVRRRARIDPPERREVRAPEQRETLRRAHGAAQPDADARSPCRGPGGHHARSARRRTAGDRPAGARGHPVPGPRQVARADDGLPPRLPRGRDRVRSLEHRRLAVR